MSRPHSQSSYHHHRSSPRRLDPTKPDRRHSRPPARRLDVGPPAVRLESRTPGARTRDEVAAQWPRARAAATPAPTARWNSDGRRLRDAASSPSTFPAPAAPLGFPSRALGTKAPPARVTTAGAHCALELGGQAFGGRLPRQSPPLAAWTYHTRAHGARELGRQAFQAAPRSSPRTCRTRCAPRDLNARVLEEVPVSPPESTNSDCTRFGTPSPYPLAFCIQNLPADKTPGSSFRIAHPASRIASRPTNEHIPDLALAEIRSRPLKARTPIWARLCPSAGRLAAVAVLRAQTAALDSVRVGAGCGSSSICGD
ncbi:hypothetical protein B0H13DRAFT_2380128 [Mycena leptocephala]|nr:hypothetical protein B0H13DRAFT_2380128 [Mycena leptocephala]